MSSGSELKNRANVNSQMCSEKDFANLYIKHSNILYKEQAIFLNIYTTPNIKAVNALYRHIEQSP